MSELAHSIYIKDLKDITAQEAKYLLQYSEHIPNKVWLKLLAAKVK